MTRFGWIFLGLVAAAVAALLSVTRFGDSGVRVVRPPALPHLGHRLEHKIAHALHLAPGMFAIPVAGVLRANIQDNWGDARGGGARVHHGTDIMAPGGTPVLAAAPGTIEKLFQSRLGGTTLYVRSPDRLWTYYYAHLSGYAPGVHEGQVVRVGDPLGFVGDTGDAGPGNYHLHFGLERLAADQRWWQGTEVNPYPQLAGRPSSR